MYKKIEKLYKKQSPYNLVRKNMFIIYLIGTGISLLFNAHSNYILMVFTMLIMLFLIIKRCEKILQTKLHISLNFNSKSEKRLKDIIKDREKELFKNYIQKENLNNEKSILCILEHYRASIKNKITGGELLIILSIIIPIPLSFIKDGKFDFKGLETALPYLISFAIVIVICYLTFRNFIEIKKIFKDEDGMVERLEEIFSELYIECVNDIEISKPIIKKKNTKLKKEQPEGTEKSKKNR